MEVLIIFMWIFVKYLFFVLMQIKRILKGKKQALLIHCTCLFKISFSWIGLTPKEDTKGRAPVAVPGNLPVI